MHLLVTFSLISRRVPPPPPSYCLSPSSPFLDQSQLCVRVIESKSWENCCRGIWLQLPPPSPPSPSSLLSLPLSLARTERLIHSSASGSILCCVRLLFCFSPWRLTTRMATLCPPVVLVAAVRVPWLTQDLDRLSQTRQERSTAWRLDRRSTKQIRGTTTINCAERIRRIWLWIICHKIWHKMKSGHFSPAWETWSPASWFETKPQVSQEWDETECLNSCALVDVSYS